MDHDIGTTFTTNVRGDGFSEFGGTAGLRGQAETQPPRDEEQGQGGGVMNTLEETDGFIQHQTDDIKVLFKTFLCQFRIGNEYCYIEMLQANLDLQHHFLEVDLTHLQQFNENLAQFLMKSPTRALPRLEEGATELAVEKKYFSAFAVRSQIQIQLFWAAEAVPVRQLAQEEVARLISVVGIVVKCNASQPKCSRATIQCRFCRSTTMVSGGRSIDLPPQCQENTGAAGRQKCGPNPYVLLPDQCEYEDQQVLKLQELPEDVPTGELPRHTTIILDRYLVDKIAPGTRIQVAGIISVHDRRGGAGDDDKSGGKKSGGSHVAGLRAQYLRCVGLMRIHGGSASSGGCIVESVNHNYSSKVRSRSRMTWQPEDEAEFKRFAREKDVYKVLSESIDPAVFGLHDIKKSIACLLFGGTRKRSEGAFLRGDMNVLLVGDPSTAKSQLLKFVETIAPIAIYTSGKGSSAAGLTASVVSSGAGEFWLEAGSMVLADGGVVCIDEFDKMREQDQVAIHEAMEQQTISIAKANLTTMLNSRTSVLAAANPIMGSYDPLRSNEEQLDFQSSILSRFDLIFKVLDPRNPERDQMIAKHVIALHKGNNIRGGGKDGTGNSQTGGSRQKGAKAGNSFLTKYIAYARSTCRPQISPEAMNTLLNFFVQIRKESHAQSVASQLGSAPSTVKGKASSGAPLIQITPRQLESLVRTTESLAKMRLDPQATVQDANEAIRLFRVSTVDAINSGIVENNLTEAQAELVDKIEMAALKHLVVGATVLRVKLVNELVKTGFDPKLVERALMVMVRREQLEYRKQKTFIIRCK